MYICKNLLLMCTEYESNSSAEQETTNYLDLRMHKLIAVRKEK